MFFLDAIRVTIKILHTTITYEDLVRFLFNEVPPADNDFLSSLNKALISESINIHETQIKKKGERVQTSTFPEEFLLIAKNYFNTSFIKNIQDNRNLILFSVVISTYNRGDRITSTVQSVLRQKGIDGRFEIIIVDDGSSDNTWNNIQNLAKREKNKKIAAFRLLRNCGPSYARNVGVFHSRGTYIAFTDDDCIVPPDWLMGFYNEFRKNPEIAGVGGWYQTHSNERERIYERYLFLSNMPELAQEYKSALNVAANKCGNTANVCYRKSAIRAIGGFNKYFVHPSLDDWELKIRMHKFLFPLKYIPSMVKHDPQISLPSFARKRMVRGWARYLTYKIHKVSPIYYNPTLLHMIIRILEMTSKLNSNFGGRIKLSHKDKIKFFFIVLVDEIFIWFGKYWVPIEIKRKRYRL